VLRALVACEGLTVWLVLCYTALCEAGDPYLGTYFMPNRIPEEVFDEDKID
jgi:hypothetical protein